MKTATKARKSPVAKPATKTAKKASVAKAFAHWPVGSTAFSEVRGPIRGALMIGALVASGFARLNKTGIATTGKPGNAKLFVGLVGATPLRHHTRDGRFIKGTLTPEGADYLNVRCERGGIVPGLVGDLAKAMTKGGEVNGLKFQRPVAG